MCKSTVDTSTMQCQCDKEKTPVDSLVRPPRKSDIARLFRMLERLDYDEAHMQRVYGDATKGSMRGSKRLDATAIRNLLAYLDKVLG